MASLAALPDLESRVRRRGALRSHEELPDKIAPLIEGPSSTAGLEASIAHKLARARSGGGERQRQAVPAPACSACSKRFRR